MKQRGFTITFVLAIIVLSLMPDEEFPHIEARFIDKWVHWIMYASLTIVSGLEDAYYDKARQRTARTIFIAVCAALFGVLMELCQELFTTSRSGDWLDAASNAFGALCGALVLGVIGRLHR